MSNNPSIPTGYKLLAQSSVTAELTAWAVKILRDPATYPMFATATLTVDARTLLARVEWHPPDFQNHAVHRGVTLYEPLAAPTSDANATGIDVSNYQPTVDWPQVALSGISFAYIKATEATSYVDRSFANHWQQSKRAGLLRGAYHFFRPQLDAIAQAEHFLTQLNDRGELPPALDVETGGGTAPAKIVASIAAWVDFITVRLGRPIVYTSPGFWNALPDTASIAKKADLWVATWDTSAPATVVGWSSWTFWQHAHTGTVPGIASALGIDQNRFNGSITRLRAYSQAYRAGLPATVPPAADLNSTLGVQRALNLLNVTHPKLTEDGVAGPKTIAAIETFQKQAGLVPDGLVGPKTRDALQTALRGAQTASTQVVSTTPQDFNLGSAGASDEP